jgi:hypothetical protein
VTAKRILYIVAAVLFVVAWLVAVGTVDADSEVLRFDALLAAGLAVGFVGHAA